ncbi:hypothetical protein [Varibaculum cambriense]|uniref:hypothetical protein n=1 Tax=Varibaculum cambriense TaxID=184870 RepID=UPI000C7C3D39|nr:hypothetical protein [Varibaculum cambriense]WIK88475.1 hypothetical protein CYK25_009900 [Varibaculum cambriense]
MRTETTKRILAALITIPIAVSLTGCGGQDSKKSEPKKPAVTSSQSVKDEKAAKEKAQAEAKAKQEVETAAKAQAPAAQQQPATNSGNKPAVQQAQKPAAPAPARRAPQRPADQYQAPAKPAYQKPATNSGNTGGGYQPKPYETYFDKNDVNSDGAITGGGDEFGNTW